MCNDSESDDDLNLLEPVFRKTHPSSSGSTLTATPSATTRPRLLVDSVVPTKAAAAPYGGPTMAAVTPAAVSYYTVPPLSAPPLPHHSTNNLQRKRSATAIVTHEATRPQKKKKKMKKKADQPHCLIWVCTHGKGQGRNWKQSALQLVGVYGSKAAAEKAKGQVMSQHECCGHGDILVGGRWDDEVDLVIRPAPLFLEESDLDLYE